jgi:hypothetical protein
LVTGLTAHDSTMKPLLGFGKRIQRIHILPLV